MTMPVAPGSIRDAIGDALAALGGEASLAEIGGAVSARLGAVPPSSVRSYLRLNVPEIFVRTGRGRYRLSGGVEALSAVRFRPVFRVGQAALYHADCFEWLAQQEAASIHAVVTDPPYGLVEYSAKEQDKLRAGKGGVWRVPPSFDGHRRAPLPRFTVLTVDDRVLPFSWRGW